jgi:hypothetical protein
VAKDSDGDGHISRSKSVASEITDIIADEFAAITMYASGELDVGFVAVEADITRRCRQAAQQRAPATSKTRSPLWALVHFVP